MTTHRHVHIPVAGFTARVTVIAACGGTLHYRFVVTTMRAGLVVSKVSVVVLLCVAAVTIAAQPAQAICVGPSISSSATSVSRGEVITITGRDWGTDCNDTNQTPDEPSMGTPVADIAVVIVQNGHRTVVATGNATSSYAFTVEVKVPSALQPGPATLTTGYETDSSSPVNLTISDAPPGERTLELVAHFGPATPVTAVGATPPVELVASDDVTSTASPVPWILRGIFVVVTGILVARVRIRRGHV